MPIKKILTTSLLGMVLTIASVSYQKTYLGVVGNLCQITTDNPSGLCYEPLPAGGFPLSYLYDRGGISVVGQLGPEDNFHLLPFIINMAIYSLSVFVIFLSYKNLLTNRRC